eukprot:jgi/Picsp_1/4081/NSC_01591-R1_e3 ubiquitin protein ligase rin2
MKYVYPILNSLVFKSYDKGGNVPKWDCYGVVAEGWCSVLAELPGSGALRAGHWLMMGLVVMCGLTIGQEVNLDSDVPEIWYSLFRIAVNRVILCAGMTLTQGFTWWNGLPWVVESVLFGFVCVSQHVMNKRISNQIQNQCQSCPWYVRHVVFATGMLGGSVVLARLSVQDGRDAFRLICGLDCLTVALSSMRGILKYVNKAMAVVMNLQIVSPHDVEKFSVYRVPAKEVAYCTGMDSLVDMVLDVAVVGMSVLEYSLLYVYRDGIYLHCYDFAILLDGRYLARLVKKKVDMYIRLSQRAQYVMEDVPTVVCGRESAQTDVQKDGDSMCAICLESMETAKRLSCGHMFHSECLLEWVKESANAACTCPVCRSDLIGGGHSCREADRLARWKDFVENSNSMVCGAVE